jgi:hypothetical protein
MIVLKLHEEQVIVPKVEDTLIGALMGGGLEPIPCSFRNFDAIGGGIRCATPGIPRLGVLQSYFWVRGCGKEGDGIIAPISRIVSPQPTSPDRDPRAIGEPDRERRHKLEI